MSLENIFYLMGIATMSLYLILLITIVIILFYIKKKVSDVALIIEEKIDIVKNAMENPGEIVKNVGATVAANALQGVIKRITGSKSKKG